MVVGGGGRGVGNGECGLLPQSLSQLAGLFRRSTLNNDDELRGIGLIRLCKKRRWALPESRKVANRGFSVDGAGDVAQVAAVSLPRCLLMNISI